MVFIEYLVLRGYSKTTKYIWNSVKKNVILSRRRILLGMYIRLAAVFSILLAIGRNLSIPGL